METPHSNRYPYVVLRIMSAFFRIMHVRFVKKIPKTLDWKNIVIENKEPYRDGALKEETKKFLVKIVSLECQKGNRRMCVVFGPKECVYCEPDGTTKESDGPPSGGLTTKLCFP
jgi:thioredoxin-related protein